MNQLIGLDDITSRIYTIRGVKVILDRDLASLYGVETRILKQAVRRNIDRFPDDFMFDLSKQEFKEWRSQFVTSNADKMGLRYPPMAFSEQGVAMLSSVLKSKEAIQVNIQIMRAFVRIRQIIFDNADLRHELEELRNQTEERFQIVFEVLDKFLAKNESARIIGFVDSDK
jgi:hypothetical protein